MIRLGWKRFLALGLGLIALSAPFGLDGVGVVFFVVGLASIAALVAGVRHHRPHQAIAWYLLAASVALFLGGGVAAEVLPARGGATPYPGWQEPFDLLGYMGCVVAVASMARARQASRDRTITLDAAISMGGVGALAWATVMSAYLHSEELTALGKATGMAFTLVSLALGFATVRVAIGPGARPTAYRLLSMAAGGAFAAEVALEIDLAGQARIPGSELFSTLISAAAVLLAAAAALHPTMASLTEPPIDVTPRVTRRRLVAMTIAVLIPPVLLVAEPTRRRNLESLAIIAVWAVLSAMVMLRIYSLARVREQLADLDQALADAEASLAGATDVAGMADAVLDGAVAIIGPLRWAAVHTWDDGWRAMAHRGPAAGGPAATAPPIGPGDDWLWRQGDAVLDLHLSAGEIRAGVVTIACAAPPDPLELGRLARLVDDLARALESAALREDLVRERSERRFRALVERSADIVMVVDGEHVVRFVSPAGPRLLRRREHEIVGHSYAELVAPDHLERFWGLVERPGHDTAELQLVAGDGRSRWFEISAADWRDESEIRGIVITASEISGRKQAQLDLERSEARFRSLVQHASDLVAVLDASGIVSWVSPSVARVLGRSQAEVVDRSVVDLAHPGDRVALADLLCRIVERGVSGADSVDLRLERAGQGWRTLEVTVTNLLGEASVEGIVLNAHDVTDRRDLEQSLRHRALHDDLTGLPNRVLLRQRTEEAARRSGTDLAMLVIDLDDFKTINDGLGHSIGDELLRQLSSRLTATLRTDDVAARLGGDEFAVLIEGAERVAVMATAQRLLRTVEEPMMVSGREIALHASIGVAFAADTVSAGANSGTVGAETMLRSADLAMYGAKNRGKGRVAVFDESMHEGAFERLELKADLARALERNELRLHYQAVIDLAQGTIAGFEALMRWEHHARGMVGPGTFIPLAEETGLIVPIGRWLMDEALGQLRQWLDRFPGAGPLTMSINLSGRQLEDEAIVGDLRAALDRADVPASAVVVELTEGIMVDDSAVLVRRLEEIRALGVGLHADDFGTGFASYAALQSLPFTGVKIDRSLVSGLDGASADRAEAQIRSIISMAATTGLKVVAEGIESGAQAAALRNLRCDHAQGFYFARPVPPAEAEAEMQRRAATGGSALA